MDKRRVIMPDLSKLETSLTTDNETMESAINNCEYLTDDKALKRKLKKERQKERKNLDKPKPVPVPETDVTNKPKRFQKPDKDESAAPVDGDDKDTNNASANEDDDDDSTDVNYTAMLSAFVQSIVSKNDVVKSLKKNDSAKGKDSVKDTNHKRDKLFTDDADGFTCVQKGGRVLAVNFCKTPEGFGKEALRVIHEGDYQLAINYLTRAIALDPTDARHYINRSYCYLRVGNFSGTLEDIRFASKHFTDITEISQAKCREAQAYCGLGNYEAAERAFSDSANLAPDYLYAHREQKRMQILQMVQMGFSERDAILALQKHPTTREAINHLAESAPTNSADVDSTGYGTDDEDEIFYSDSEDNPSNERLLSKMINYDPNTPEEPTIHEPPPSKDIVKPFTQPLRAQSADRTLRIIKAVATPVKTKKPNQSINDKAVWVGSISTNAITDSMLQKRFGKFGKVTSVWRPLNENYAFVNFQCATGPQKAFEEARYNSGNIDLNGTKLPIKEATMKTFK